MIRVGFIAGVAICIGLYMISLNRIAVANTNIPIVHGTMVELRGDMSAITAIVLNKVRTSTHYGQGMYRGYTFAYHVHEWDGTGTITVSKNGVVREYKLVKHSSTWSLHE